MHMFNFSDLKQGDQLAVIFKIGDKELFHHGIYLSESCEVIDFSIEGLRKIDLFEFWQWTENQTLFRLRFPGKECNPNAVVKEALALYNKKKKWQPYDFLKNNCEHFATWCKTKNRISQQSIHEMRKSLIEKCLTAANVIKHLKRNKN